MNTHLTVLGLDMCMLVYRTPGAVPTPEARVGSHDSSECDQRAQSEVSSQARCGRGQRSRKAVPTAIRTETCTGCKPGSKSERSHRSIKTPPPR